jgi:hypothetical protein
MIEMKHESALHLQEPVSPATVHQPVSPAKPATVHQPGRPCGVSATESLPT